MTPADSRRRRVPTARAAVPVAAEVHELAGRIEASVYRGVGHLSRFENIAGNCQSFKNSSPIVILEMVPLAAGEPVRDGT